MSTPPPFSAPNKDAPQSQLHLSQAKSQLTDMTLESGSRNSQSIMTPDDVAANSSQSKPPQDHSIDDTPTDEELTPHGFGETNSRTHGKEFYGAAATLAFLLELRSRARTFRQQNTKKRTDRHRSRSSIVNLMDGDGADISISEVEKSPGESEAVAASPESHRALLSPISLTPSSFTLTNETIERQCINSYFSNLHVIYLFLDRAAFMKRCEQEIWSRDPKTLLDVHCRQKSNFPALYNAVVAVGALTGGADILSDPSSVQTKEFWDNLAQKCNAAASVTNIQPHLSLELAKIFFARAKALLGEFFEACNLESQQALFLMSIFCQHSLKPHGCYMYNGMAVRTAMAIGSSNLPDIRKNPLSAIRTWWSMYYHEAEVCCALGRETILRDPDHYPVFLANFGDPFPINVGPEHDENLFFGRSLTELARILRQISEEVYVAGSDSGAGLGSNRHQAAWDLDAKLLKWKDDLKPVFDLDRASLTEKESVTKRKIMLQLRFQSTRIMIHRPFLVAAARQRETRTFEISVQICLETAQQTIQLLFETFINRPFFRTWWYNTTYAFNAASIILYTLVARLYRGSSKALLADVEKTLKIFQAMDTITVARRCGELTQEIFEVAKMSLQQIDGRTDHPKTSQHRSNLNTTPQSSISGAQGISLDLQNQYGNTFAANWGANGTTAVGSDFPHDGFFSDIMDVNILDSFGANPMGLDVDDASYTNFDTSWTYSFHS